MNTHRIVLAFCKCIILAVLAGMVAAALTHDLELIEASPSKTGAYPVMIYDTYTMGDTGVAGADFGDIYMSAKALRHGESAYHSTSKAFADPFGRPKNYPPLMYWLYVPLSKLEFWPALVIHTVVSFLAIFGATVFALWKAALRHYIGWVILAQLCLFFLSPIGATHFERGQFDLLVASMVVTCFTCSFLERGLFVVAIATGVAGALKWTSLPILGCFSALGFLLTSGRRRWSFFVLPLMTLLATFAFLSSLKEYWSSIRYFDVDADACGVTLRHFLPATWVKAVPVAVTLALGGIVWFRARSALQRERLFADVSAPFVLVLANLSICFPSVSFEYHTVTLLGVLPCLVIWVSNAKRVPALFKVAACGLYMILCVIAFRILDQFKVLSPLEMSKVYVAFTAALFIVAVSIVVLREPDEVPSQLATTP